MLVLLTANVNLSKGLVNGSTGKIVGFVEMKDENMPRAYTGKKSKDNGKYSGQVSKLGRKMLCRISAT